MPLTPQKEFHYDDTWPAQGARVYLTAARVWGPLGGLLLIVILALL